MQQLSPFVVNLFIIFLVLSPNRKGTTVKSLCQNVSTQMLRDFNFALVWGKSAKHSPQRCGINHELNDEDVVQVVTKTNAQQRQSKNYQAIVQANSDKVSDTCVFVVLQWMTNSLTTNVF